MISVQGLNKSFKVARRSSGLRQATKALFHRDYQTVHALSDISFSIQPGEIVGYIGPNGAGKSTTIKVMSGILVPDSGSCEIMGYTPWKDRARYVKNIGVVFGQRSQLWWDVPVIDSFELLRDIYKVSPSEYKANLSLLVETLQLSDLLHTPVRQLSLGQRMRCEIAASLLHSPTLLFLDEPTIGLDAVSKLAVRQFIKTYNNERNLTVILTTHDMNDIEALAERLILIGKGHILFDGRLKALREKFGAHKTLTIDYKESASNIDIIGTTILSQTGQRAVLGVDTKQINVSEVIGKLSEQLELSDVSVEAQPIEELIVQLYQEYEL
ncbi:ABC-2 type transport system ATP-binding protein [Pullulanibacillus pueri]|uniref:ABC transporter ATP-binding protein n=1 Tax=Pullulanibacillus pueri TaxID=1437324 RepID=A0A8J2ZY46_9BACL|nr:ABC transporter ATP-binding protein [Pullulanibacillus pueri]MBM7683603.1 ABC-2 type transport system ATP-binding protein [Pullulanibacillus pueri]GGH84557.1 ABC transporter ATP-binding protein [Pullulanibacillus pueri]